MKTLQFTYLLLGLAFILSSCRHITQYGFQGSITVRASKYTSQTNEEAKERLIKHIYSLGLTKIESSSNQQNNYKPNYLHFQNPKKSQRHFINIYINDPEKIRIIIRDTTREYPKSKSLKIEIQNILNLLKDYYDDSEITLEIQSTFLS